MWHHQVHQGASFETPREARGAAERMQQLALPLEKARVRPAWRHRIVSRTRCSEFAAAFNLMGSGVGWGRAPRAAGTAPGLAGSHTSKHTRSLCFVLLTGKRLCPSCQL